MNNKQCLGKIGNKTHTIHITIFTQMDNYKFYFTNMHWLYIYQTDC